MKIPLAKRAQLEYVIAINRHDYLPNNFINGFRCVIALATVPPLRKHLGFTPFQVRGKSPDTNG
jgi:hypothetical protein